MMTTKNQFTQNALAAMLFVLVLGTLSMIWPAIMALMFGIFLLLQSCGAEQEVAVLSWAEISTVPIAFTSLRPSDSPALLS